VPSLVAETNPDFLLIAFDEPQRRPALCDLLLREFPALRIIAVAPNTNVGIYYWASFEIHAATMEARPIIHSERSSNHLAPSLASSSVFFRCPISNDEKIDQFASVLADDRVVFRSGYGFHFGRLCPIRVRIFC
jgi:hypothetical protein